MWLKDDYQEHMMGYLDRVRTEIERLAQSCLQQHQVSEFYTDLATAFECLRQLIAASDVEWERFRHMLETSCDALLRAFYRVPAADPFIFSVCFMVMENDAAAAQVWEPAAVMG